MINELKRKNSKGTRLMNTARVKKKKKLHNVILEETKTYH